MKSLLSLSVLLINVISVLSAAVYRVKVDTTLNVRKAANTKSAVVASLRNGQYIYATGISNGFAKFYKGYASTSYLTKVTSGGNNYVVTADALNFRTGPSQNVITTLKQGTTVKVYGTDPFNSGWYVTNRGYASTSYLKPKSGDPVNPTQVAKEVYKFFKAKGWTKNAICGMLGNMERESGLKPDTNQIGGGSGYGLVQWTPGSVLKNWANSEGLNYRTTRTQCLRIQYEYDNGLQFYKTKACPLNFKQYVKSTKSPEYLAECFMRNYERAGVEALGDRKTYARKWFNKL